MTKMLQWKRLLATVFVVLASLAIAVMPVMAQPVTSPCTGGVTIDGVPAPDGSGVRVYVGTETAPRLETATVGGIYEALVVGVGADVGKALSFKVREAGEIDWRNATTDPPSPTFLHDDPQVVDLFASTGPIIWNCPLDHVALIAPYPANDRPFLTASANLSDVIYDVEWFQVLWLSEGNGGWLTYYSEFTIGNTLTTLEPDQYYYVIVSEPCELEIP
jgi:hypothetical protein